MAKDNNDPILQFLWVPPSMLSTVWPKAYELLRKARAFFECYATEKYVLEQLHNGHMQLFLVNDESDFTLAFLTEIREYDCVRSLNVVCVGGKDFRLAIRKFWPVFVDWAKERCVSELVFRGRPGFQRLFKKYGFVHAYTAIKLNLKNTRVH